MSINHISSETLWWTKQQQQYIMMDSTKKSSIPSALWPNNNTPQFYHHHHPPTPPETLTTTTMLGFNLNNMTKNDEDEEVEEQQMSTEEKDQNLEREEQEIPKEQLFEKPLTPSDVGKLNRLVIPKQHAEKYFPLSGNINNNNESGEKGLLLSFEDESGKAWRFRYSYWNSSQSYVLTKGWSRFVKEKRLDAGDIVLFERHRLDGERFFIGWRRRNAVPAASPMTTPVQEGSAVAQPGMVGGGGWAHQVYYGGGSGGHPYPGAGLPYQPDCAHAGRGVMQSQTIRAGVNTTRRQVRLFGVNLDCEAEESSPPTSDGGGSSMSSHRHHPQGPGQASQHYYQHQFQYSKPHGAVPAATSYNNNNHHNHMDMNFSRDINQMRYHQG